MALTMRSLVLGQLKFLRVLVPDACIEIEKLFQVIPCVIAPSLLISNSTPNM